MLKLFIKQKKNRFKLKKKIPQNLAFDITRFEKPGIVVEVTLRWVHSLKKILRTMIYNPNVHYWINHWIMGKAVLSSVLNNENIIC